MDNSCSFKPASPASPAAQWIGGKRHLAPRICALIESTPHRVYAEPFVGMGGVFLRRAVAAQVEAINDRDGEVANLFRVLQRHFSPLMDMLQWQVASRAEFQRLAAQDPTLLTDLERAARFLYLQRLAYGGKVRGRSFGIDTLSPSDFNVGKLRGVLQAIHERLAGVTIDCLDWNDFLERWDRDESLFYLDPPYYGVETYYAAKFPRADHERLAGALAGLRGQFILSMNDLPQTRAIYGAFPLETVRLNDATSRILSIFLVEEEGTWSSLRGIGGRSRRKGCSRASTPIAAAIISSRPRPAARWTPRGRRRSGGRWGFFSYTLDDAEAADILAGAPDR